MHEITAIEVGLWKRAQEISAEKDAPVVIILAGDGNPGIERCMIGSSLQLDRGYRLLDLLGTLELAKQGEADEDLNNRAAEIGEEFRAKTGENERPLVIVILQDGDNAKIGCSAEVSLRDRVGTLEAAKQIESVKHLWPVAWSAWKDRH